MTSGIAQGSKLGPLLFDIFINDLISILKYSNIDLFADDCIRKSGFEMTLLNFKLTLIMCMSGSILIYYILMRIKPKKLHLREKLTY